ncbi:MAG: formate dehydrogenase accessory sulfurtransferase FdhD [Myxococcota bacterium]
MGDRSALPATDEAGLDGVRTADVLRVSGATRLTARDRVAHEEPLEIQLAGTPLAVVMRTPGDDLELVTGFLVTERVVESLEEVESVRTCNETPSSEAEGNVVRVTLAPGVRPDLERLRRNQFASSSCGVCGKATLENALATAPPLEDGLRMSAAALTGLPSHLRATQPVFDETGGLHAAGLFDGEGRLLVAREDVGRHNAVDKAVGWAARAGRLPLTGTVLLVSGRASFEIVQKALAARIPIVAAVSAPSSLAVSLADAAGIALVGFLRGPGYNVYSHPERIRSSAS